MKGDAVLREIEKLSKRTFLPILGPEKGKHLVGTVKIEVHIGNALALIPRMNGNFEMVFLDAAKDEYLEYLKLSENKLRRGGVVFADNVKTPTHEMRDYLNYVRNSGRYRSDYVDMVFDGVEISTKLFWFWISRALHTS